MTENEYPRLSNCIGGLPMPGTILCYSMKGDFPEIKKYTGQCQQDPLPYALMEELHIRYLSHFPQGKLVLDFIFIMLLFIILQFFFLFL